MIPSDAPIESRFITAACTGITSDRKTTTRSSAANAITTPMNNGILLDRTWEKSTCDAVAPPTYTRAPVLCSTGGITVSRSRVTRLEV